jgi:hypothetical protein
MMRKPFFAVSIISTILLVYCILVGFNISLPVAFFIFSISPFLVAWLAYTIIRFGSYEGKEFAKDDECGYQDKRKEDLDLL